MVRKLVAVEAGEGQSKVKEEENPPIHREKR